MAFSANESEEEKSVVDVTDLCADIVGANACDVLAIDAARSKLLAENSFMVAVAMYGIFLDIMVRKCQVHVIIMHACS